MVNCSIKVYIANEGKVVGKIVNMHYNYNTIGRFEVLLNNRVWLKTFCKLQHCIRVEGMREKTEIGDFLHFWSPVLPNLHLELYPFNFYSRNWNKTTVG